MPYDGKVRPVRPCAVAGSWYPDDPVQLSAELNRYVSAARPDLPPRHLHAVIAPHAGLMYSGPVAAFAYKAARDAAMRGNVIKTVVLVGPSHFVPFRGVALWPDGSWATPFGHVEVDVELAEAIRRESALVREMPEAHGREHSLEMQLPFIAHLLPGAMIVPLVIGEQTRDTAFALGEAIVRAIGSRTSGQGTEAGADRVPAETAWDGAGPTPQRPGDVLIVASSDLSHYEDAHRAAALDGMVARHVEALDPDGLMTLLEHDPRHACGGGAIVAVMHAARQLGATDARVLRYADSGDVSGDKSAVVGYMAAALW